MFLIVHWRSNDFAGIGNGTLQVEAGNRQRLCNLRRPFNLRAQLIKMGNQRVEARQRIAKTLARQSRRGIEDMVTPDEPDSMFGETTKPHDLSSSRRAISCAISTSHPKDLINPLSRWRDIRRPERNAFATRAAADRPERISMMTKKIPLTLAC